MARTAWSNWFASMGMFLHDDGFREVVGGEHEEYMHLTGRAGEAVHNTRRHEERYARCDVHSVFTKGCHAFSGEEGEALLDRVRVQQHTLSGLEPLLGDEEATRTDA
jgi:hypothetical protein